MISNIYCEIFYRRGVAVLPASRRHECHLNRRLPSENWKIYTGGRLVVPSSSPLGPLGRASSYECTHSSNRAALIEGGHPWNVFSLLAHKTRRAPTPSPTTRPIHVYPWRQASFHSLKAKDSKSGCQDREKIVNHFIFDDRWKMLFPLGF